MENFNNDPDPKAIDAGTSYKFKYKNVLAKFATEGFGKKPRELTDEEFDQKLCQGLKEARLTLKSMDYKEWPGLEKMKNSDP